MQNTNLSKENAEIRRYEYVAPDCEVIIVKTQGVICTSETEKVEEIDGEW